MLIRMSSSLVKVCDEYDGRRSRRKWKKQSFVTSMVFDRLREHWRHLGRMVASKVGVV